MFKKKISAIAFLLAVLMLFSVFAVACDSEASPEDEDTDEETEETEKKTSKPTKKPTEKVTETEPDEETEPEKTESEETDPEETEPEETEAEGLDDSMFNIFSNKEYLCRFVWGDKATTAEKYVAKELRTLIQAKTGKQITFVTADKVTEEYEFIVLLGETDYDESKAVYDKIGEREAIIEIIGNKLVVAFDTQASGIGAVRKLMEDVDKNSDGDMRLALDTKVEYKALPEIDVLPEYEDGTVKEIDCGENTIMRHVKGSNAAILAAYAEGLADYEFVKISERKAEGNEFYTYRSESHYIYMYYTKYNGEIRIITGPIDALCEEDYSSDLPETYTPYIASIPQPNDGQGYIIRLADGRFIIQDGGYTGGERVYSTLKKLEPNKDIVIAAWFISHPHSDHYPAFIDFIKYHGSDKDITIERVIHNYVHHDMYTISGTAGNDNSTGNVKELYLNAKQYIPNVPMIKAHTGQFIDFGSIQIEVLYTIEDMVPGNIENINATSMVFRMLTEGQSLMMLADTYVTSANILCKMWGNYLKSDIVQVAHHAIWPATAELYDKIQGKLLLITAMKRNYKGYVDDSRWNSVTAAYLKYATHMSLSLDEMVIIEFPFKFENNEFSIDAVLADVRS